ncbi:HAD-IB family phosphatase [Pseudomonas sp. ODNR1LW]|nr:HAD-IB family phosphatase [Pseudomonas sp. ODNR1LW]
MSGVHSGAPAGAPFGAPFGPLSGGNVIFDYDRTLVPEESLLEVVRLSLRRCPDGEARIRALQERAARVTTGKARIGDVPMLLAGLFSVNREAADLYVDVALETIRPFQPVFEGLRREGARLFIVSAAYRDWLVPITARYGFPAEAVAANRFCWRGDRTAGPANWPLALSSDKTALVRRWRRNGILNGPAVMVGDSAGDFAIFAEGLAQGFVAAGHYADNRFSEGELLRRSRTVREVAPMAADLLTRLLRSAP